MTNDFRTTMIHKTQEHTKQKKYNDFECFNK